MKQVKALVWAVLAAIVLAGCAAPVGKPRAAVAPRESALATASQVGWTLSLPRDLPE